MGWIGKVSCTLGHLLHTLQAEKGFLQVEDTCVICILCHVVAMFFEIAKIYCITMGLDELLG